MKILFIADILPDLTSGSAVRNYYVLQALSSNHEVEVIGLCDNAHDVNTDIYKDLHVRYTLLERKSLNIYQRLWYLLLGKIPYVQQRTSIVLPYFIQQKLKTYDLIHLSELNAYFFMKKYMNLIIKPVVLDAHNVEYKRLKAELAFGSFLKKIAGSILVWLVKSYEIQAIKKISCLLVCSSIDKQYFEQYISNENIYVIPNGVDISYFSQHIVVKSKKISIVFMGLLSYFPNTEGLQYYFNEIHPFIIKKFPKSKIHIIGKNAPLWLIQKAKHDSTIILHGFVKDTRMLIAQATVCIAPLLSGSGTRLKILEYMAMGKAIVSTIQAAEGLEVLPNKNILVAHNSMEFINALLNLIQNPNMSSQIGKNAYSLVATRYDWKHIAVQLNLLYAHLI